MCVAEGLVEFVLLVCLLGGAFVGRRVAFMSLEMMEGPYGRVVCSQLYASCLTCVSSSLSPAGSYTEEM